jgi:hypothetical protein
MNVLVATSLTQGVRQGDYHYCIEGELVWVQEPCDRDLRNPEGPCGCGRGFAGAASHRATSTAVVVDSELTREDLILAFKTSLDDGGWPVEWAEAVVDENIHLANQFPAGTVVERRLDRFTPRGRGARS